MVDVSKPLHPNQARKLLNEILRTGTVFFTKHARKEMAADGLAEADIIEVLQKGRIAPSEFERGSWRYRITIERTYAVAAFRSEVSAVVITAWRVES